MKKHLLFLTASVFSLAAQSQVATVLHANTFESGGAGITMNTTDVSGSMSSDNPWVLNNIYAGGSSTFFCPALGFNVPFTVPGCATQPAGITSNPTSTYLHVTPAIAVAAGGTVPAASYITGDGFCIFGGNSSFTKMSADVNTVGQDSVTLDLWWMCGGNSIYYGELYYSTNGGGAWTAVNCPVGGTNKWNGQTTWANSIIWNANWDNQATLRFGFRFVTANTTIGGETDPGFAIDDIEITGYVDGPTCTPTSSAFNLNACDSQTSPSGLYTWTVDGTYNDTIPNTGGCDSVMVITVDISTVDNGAVAAGYTITADETGATYQWLDCNNAYAVIPGATSQAYSPSVDGDYAVKVTKNGCTDTSSCFTISGLGLQYITQDVFNVYPNPTTGDVHVSLGNDYLNTTLVVYSLDGQLVQNTIHATQSLVSFKLEGESGVYFVHIITPEETRVVRVVKN